MASIEDIIWSDKVYSPLSLFTKYGHHLPVYVLLTNSFTTTDDQQTTPVKQVARIDSVCEQKRVLIQDMTGQYYSAPEDYKRKFTIKEKRKIRKKTLKGILKHYTLPVPVSSEFPLLKSSDGSTDDVDRKKFLILAVYPEKFFRMNIINEAGLIDSTVSLLPVYKMIDIQLADGMNNSSKTTLSDMIKLYNCVVRKFNFSSVKGVPYVLMLTKEDIRNHTPPIIKEMGLPGMKHNDTPPVMQKKRYSWRGGTKTKPKIEIKTETKAEDKIETETETETETIPTSREENLVLNGNLTNGRAVVAVASSSQTDDEGSMLTDDVTSSGVSPRDGSTMTKTSVGKPVQVTSAPLQPRASTEREGYFSETEAQRVIRQEVLSRKMYSSTGDLWRGPSTLENEPPVVTMVGSRGRHRRIYRPRSLSMNHVDGIRHYGTTLLASGRLDRDFGFYGDSEKPATFRRRVPVPVIANSCSSPVGSWTGSWTADGRRGLYRKRSEVAPSRYHTIHHVTKTIPDELPNGLRTAAIIKLRDVKPVTYSATLLGSRPDDVIVNFAPVQRSNSCSYDVSQGRTSPTLSIPLGDSRDINISTLPRSGGTRWRFITDADDDEVFYSGRRQGAVLSPGVPLVEPEKDLELLHIEVQGAEKEWTLKREKAAKSPSQYSSGTDASVQTDPEQQEVSRTRHHQHQARESRARTRQVDEYRVVTNSRHKAQERKGKPRQFYEVQDFELNGTRQERREPKGKARESYDYVDYDVNSSRRESRVDGSGGWRDGGRSRGKRAAHREYNDDRRRRAEDKLDGATEHEHVTYTESRHGVLADRHLQSAGQLDSHQPELFYDIDLVGRHHVTSGHRRADFGAVGDQRIEVKRTEIGSHTTAGTRRVPLVDPTVDKRSHLLGSTSVDVHAFSTLPVAKSPGVATSHISRRFQYQPVQHRYRNRNHYYSSQGWNLITTGVGYEDVDGECQLESVRSPGLEKFPDFVYDRSRLRDVRISYTDDSTSDADGSTPTLTPARNSIAGDDAAENDANGYDDRFETGSHVQVINVGEDDVGGERLVTTETQQTSEIVVFTDSSGAVYDTALTSMLERSRNEAMQELDRMTESSWTADAKDDVTGETAAGRVVTKQDDNNNITGFVGGQAGDGGADRESDSASSISSSTSGEGAGSYHVSGAVSSSRQLAGDGERTERSKTYTSSTANVISTNPEAASNGAGLHPGEVTLKSTENVKDVSREIRKAVVRANSVGSPDQQPDFRNELQAVLRLRSVSMEEEGEERAKEPEVGTSARQSVSDAVQADTENRCNRDDVIADGVEPEVEREASYVAVTESTETTAVSVERDQMMTSSSSSSSSSCEIRTSSMTELISGVDVKAPAHDPAKDRVVEALVRTGSVSSLRQVYKTPPSSLRQKRPTLSVAKSSDIFANSANDVGRAKPTASGKFVMRFREGDGGAGSADEKRAPPLDYTRSPASVRSQASADRIEVNQDMSLPANEEVQFAEGGGYPESERYSIQQSDDTLSQSSYSSSKLEHFNFGLSNFQSNF